MSQNQQQQQTENTMYYMLHKIAHFETLEDRIVELENRNLELEVNFKILKTQLDNLSPQFQNFENKIDSNPVENDSEELLKESTVNPIELVSTTLNGSQNENDVVDEPGPNPNQMIKSEAMMDCDYNSSNNNSGVFIDMFDQFLMENASVNKSKPTNSTTTNNNSMKTDSTNKCIICLKNFQNSRKLSTHYNSHNVLIDIDSSKFECKICPKFFTIRPDFVHHMREHLGKKFHECPICSRKFNKLVVLRTHLRVHTGEKPYSCTICKRKFSQMPSLRRHKRIHNGEKPYGCIFCPKFFRAKDHLVTHIRMHTGEKPYECSMCTKKFSRKQTLDQHFKYKH